MTRETSMSPWLLEEVRHAQATYQARRVGRNVMHSPSHRFAVPRHASSQQLSNAPIERRSDFVWQRDRARCLGKRVRHARAQFPDSRINLRRR